MKSFMKICLPSLFILLVLLFISLNCNTKHEPQIGFIGLYLGESKEVIDKQIIQLQNEGKIENVNNSRETFNYNFNFDQKVGANVSLFYGKGYLYTIFISGLNNFYYDEILKLYKNKYKGRWEQYEGPDIAYGKIKMGSYEICLYTLSRTNSMTITYAKKEDTEKDI